jgi:hypothetical protein
MILGICACVALRAVLYIMSLGIDTAHILFGPRDLRRVQLVYNAIDGHRD